MATIQDLGALCLLEPAYNHRFEFFYKGKVDSNTGELGIEAKSYNASMPKTAVLTTADCNEFLKYLWAETNCTKVVKLLGACRVVLVASVVDGKKHFDLHWQRREKAGSCVFNNISFFDTNVGIRLFSDTHNFRHLTDLVTGFNQAGYPYKKAG